jgi:TldD protein
MPKALRVAACDPIVGALRAEAESRGVYVIGRIQDRVARHISVNNGKLERVESGAVRGMGVQVFTEEGACGFACSDELSEAEARNLVAEATALARNADTYDAERNRAIFELPATPERVRATETLPLDQTSLERQISELLDLNRAAMALAEGLSVRAAHAAGDEEWRIVRSDGTDIAFDMPRAYVQQSITALGPGGGTTVGAAVSGAGAEVLWGPEFRARMEKRSARAAALARELLEAEPAPAGHYKIVMDYALAKGLAHEAFGHAAETDGMTTSILGREGKIRLGETLAAPHVTITDGPVLGDFAYQPISANGQPRQTVAILERGVLRSGLGDVFSADRAGAPLTGAERAESYRSVPVPRMTNIRITVDEPVVFETPFEDVTPEELRERLLATGLMRDGERVFFLSGYRGGQVNPRDGDFVFNCAAIYDFSSGVKLYRPAILSGKVLSALHSLSAGLGPLYLDAMGHCGKAGQSVPSSGGAHMYILMEENPDVMIGGS